MGRFGDWPSAHCAWKGWGANAWGSSSTDGIWARAQMPAQAPPGMYTDFMRHAAQLAHHQMELAQAQLLPHVLLPGSLAMCVETTQPAPSVPAGALLGSDILSYWNLQ